MVTPAVARSLQNPVKSRCPGTIVRVKDPAQKTTQPQDCLCDEAQFISEVLSAEAEAISRLVTNLPSDGTHWNAALDLLEPCTGHVVVSGMGKSGLVGAKISATLSSLGQPSTFVHPAEAVHGDLGRIRRGDIVLMLSFSGETDELISLAHILKADSVKMIGVTGCADSTLARSMDVHVDLGGITEACPLNLAPTASTTAMMAIGDALALALARRRNFEADDFHRHHPGGMLGAGLRPVTDVLRFRVGENLPVVRDTTTVREALRQAGGKRRAGAIVLVDDADRLSGIFTDGDLRRLVNTSDDPASGLAAPINQCMTPSPRHLRHTDLVRDAVRLVRELRLDEIPVVGADGTPLGLIDVQDLIAMKVVVDPR
jgi:arabinose-5-phosphate isomerase